MKTTKIFKTYEDARKYAASQFNCEYDAVIDNEFNNSRYGWTTCVCGQTTCAYFTNPFEEDSIEYLTENLPGEIACGICDSCGEAF